MLLASAMGGLFLTSGCAAFRPIHGIPVEEVPREHLHPPRAGKKTIDLSLLRQDPPREYLLDSGDVLAVYIEGILPRRDTEVAPVNFPLNGESAPTMGYPIPVRDDGTVSVPMVVPINVRGMTIRQAEEAVRRAYTEERKILRAGQDRILVSLQRPRTYRVLVIRQESPGAESAQGGQGQVIPGNLKRGTGKVIALPAYKNDVLNALAETGGLPGLDAENTIYVIRRRTPEMGYGTPQAIPSRQQNGFVPPPAPAMEVERPGGASSFRPQRGPAFRGTSPTAARGLPIRPVSSRATKISLVGYDGGSSERSRSSSRNVARANSGAGVIQAGGSDRMPSGVVQTAAQEQYLPAPGANSAGSSLPPRGQERNFRPGPSISPSPDTNFSPTGRPGAIGPYGNGNGFQGGPAHDMPQGSPGEPMLDAHGGMFSENFLPSADGSSNSCVVNCPDTINSEEIVKIPVRLACGARANIDPNDIILRDGDIVFIETRDTEIFYTGGLLGGGQYQLPRDYDLDILDAIAVAQGQSRSSFARAVGGVSAMNSDVTISASQAIILRRIQDGSQLAIKVDLYKAVRNPAERILIQPGDHIVLQYSRIEAVGAFFERHLLEGALFGVAAAQLNKGGGGN